MVAIGASAPPNGSVPPAQPAKPESDDIVRLVNDYIGKIFRDFPIAPELRREREECIRADILLFVRDVRAEGIPDTKIEEVLYERFGDPGLLRDLYLRADSEIAVWNDRSGVWALAGLFAASIVTTILVKVIEFFVSWRLPQFASLATGAAPTVLLTLAAITGIIGYVANGKLRGNPYRIIPWVVASTIAFLIAGSVRMEINILERQPQLRTDVLISMALPIINMNGQSLIHRYIADYDFTGLPREFTRATPLVTEREEISSALFRFFWLVAVCVAVANYYVISTLAGIRAILGNVM